MSTVSRRSRSRGDALDQIMFTDDVMDVENDISDIESDSDAESRVNLNSGRIGSAMRADALINKQSFNDFRAPYDFNFAAWTNSSHWENSPNKFTYEPVGLLAMTFAKAVLPLSKSRDSVTFPVEVFFRPSVQSFDQLIEKINSELQTYGYGVPEVVAFIYVVDDSEQDFCDLVIARFDTQKLAIQLITPPKPSMTAFTQNFAVAFKKKFNSENFTQTAAGYSYANQGNFIVLFQYMAVSLFGDDINNTLQITPRTTVLNAMYAGFARLAIIMSRCLQRSRPNLYRKFWKRGVTNVDRVDGKTRNLYLSFMEDCYNKGVFSRTDYVELRTAMSLKSGIYNMNVDAGNAAIMPPVSNALEYSITNASAEFVRGGGTFTGRKSSRWPAEFYERPDIKKWLRFIDTDNSLPAPRFRLS